MTVKKVFCEHCRDDVEYTVKRVSETAELRGKNYTFTSKEARCGRCGSLVYLPEFHDANLKALYDVFRKENDILPVSVIKSVPKKYNIGKRSLSLLLGWGEHTYTRYCEGHLPPKAYSDMIKKIADSPEHYITLLKENKDVLTAGAYEKSLKAAEALISDTNKIGAVSRYIVFQCGDITNLALQKTLYYAQGFYRAFYGEYLFPDDCEAWAHGPVYREIYNRYKGYGYDIIGEPAAPDDSALTLCEKTILDSVINAFCCYSGKTLERFTHAESPWLDTRDGIPDNAPSDKIIAKDAIADYFGKVKTKYNMIIPGDIKEYALTMFDLVC